MLGTTQQINYIPQTLCCGNPTAGSAGPALSSAIPLCQLWGGGGKPRVRQRHTRWMTRNNEE